MAKVSKDASLDNFAAERAGLEVRSIPLSLFLLLSPIARTDSCALLWFTAYETREYAIRGGRGGAD